MGMYTELVFKATIKSDTDKKVIQMLRMLFDEDFEGEIPKVPEHAFFNCDRWKHIGNCSSYYHIPKATQDMWYDVIAGQWFIFSRSDLKNYNGEIELFVDWVRPYLEGMKDTCIGWKLYEENAKPTLLYIGE